MFEAADVREWRGHDVVAQGHMIGELEAVYVNTGTDQPSFGTVKVGMPTRRRLVLMPFDQATVGPGLHQGLLRQEADPKRPAIGTDGELSMSGEEAIFKHYGFAYQPGAGGERRLAHR